MQRGAKDDVVDRFSVVGPLCTHLVESHLQLRLLLLRVSLQEWLETLGDLSFELVRSLCNLAFVACLCSFCLHPVKDVLIFLFVLGHSGLLSLGCTILRTDVICVTTGLDFNFSTSDSDLF